VTARASDSMFHPLTMCALQIVLWLWLLSNASIFDFACRCDWIRA